MWQRQAVALRPLGAGERIDAAIKIVRRSFLTFVKAALVVAIPTAILSGVILLSVSSTISNAFSFGDESSTTSDVHSLQTIFGAFAVLELLTLAVGALITAISVRVVANSYLGQPTTWRDAVAFGARRFLSVLWIELLTFLVYGAGGVVLALLAALLASTHAGIAIAASVLLFIGGGVAVIWFGVATSLAVPILMIENVRGWKAIRRSLSLNRNRWWSTFATLLIAILLAGVGTTILRIVLGFVLSLFGGGLTALLIETFVIALLSTLLFASFFAAVQVVITIDLRVRKEGFDIQLLASQMGVSPTSSALSFLPPPPDPGWGFGGYPGWSGPPGPPPPGWGGGYSGGYRPPPGPPWGGGQAAPPGWASPPPTWRPPPPGWAQPPPPPGWAPPTTQGWPQPGPAWPEPPWGAPNPAPAPPAERPTTPEPPEPSEDA